METPKVLDFRVNPKTVENPRYRYLRIPLNNVQGDIQLSAASSLLEFKIPSTCVNLARSYIQYSLELENVNNRYNWSMEDLSVGEVFTSVQFGSASGLYLVDLNYLQNYEKVKLKMKTKYEDFISRDPLNSYYPAHSIGAALAANSTMEVNYNMAPLTIVASNNYKSPAQVNDYVAPFKFSDPKYALVDAQGGANAAGRLVRNRQISLSDIKDTLLSEDKDFYSPIEMYLRFMTNQVTRVGSNSGSDAVPGEVPAVGGQNPVAAIPPQNVAATLKNVYLYLAVEQNQVLVDELKSSVLSGNHRFKIPYTVGFRNAVAAGVANTQIPITSQYGKKLHHILFTVANNNEAQNLACDASNWNGSKVSSYQVYLDNRPLTDYTISCAQASRFAAGVNSDDWRENKKFIENKLMNYGQYQLNWFHCDAFYDPITGDDGIDLTNSDAGVDLEAVRLYQVQLNTQAACNIYTYATFLREVMLDNTGNILFG